jgi:hypothetical protein
LIRTPADESRDPALACTQRHEGIKSIATNNTRIVHAIPNPPALAGHRKTTTTMKTAPNARQRLMSF